MTLPRNPDYPSAISLDDIRENPNISFAVIKGGEIALTGTFVGQSEYTEEGGWSDIPATNDFGEQIPVNPYETGIVCRPNGEWLQGVVVLSLETAD